LNNWSTFFDFFDTLEHHKNVHTPLKNAISDLFSRNVEISHLQNSVDRVDLGTRFRTKLGMLKAFLIQPRTNERLQKRFPSSVLPPRAWRGLGLVRRSGCMEYSLFLF